MRRKIGEFLGWVVDFDDNASELVTLKGDYNFIVFESHVPKLFSTGS